MCLHFSEFPATHVQLELTASILPPAIEKSSSTTRGSSNMPELRKHTPTRRTVVADASFTPTSNICFASKTRSPSRKHRDSVSQFRNFRTEPIDKVALAIEPDRDLHSAAILKEGGATSRSLETRISPSGVAGDAGIHPRLRAGLEDRNVGGVEVGGSQSATYFLRGRLFVRSLYGS